MEESIEAVKEFYDQSALMEWGRMDRNPFEFEITKAYLKRYIRPGDRVLDVGGGPGRYSLWLAELGAEVTLLDLSGGNVALAKEKAAEYRLPLTALQGDARFADQLAPGPFDHVLLMGPLYHLLKEEDRTAAVRACLDCLKPGGMLFCAFISNYSNLVYLLSQAQEAISDPQEAQWLCCLKAGENYAGPAFTQAFFIQPGEIDPFMARFPLKKRHLFGCEGIAAAFQRQLATLPEGELQAWLRLSLALCEREELLSWAEHLMYVGQKDL